jgi:hypothetical protein
MHSGDDVDRLWSNYQRTRQEALEARRQAITAIGQETGRRLTALSNWYYQIRESIADDWGLTRLGKADRLGKLDLEYTIDKAAIERKARERRQQARIDHRPPTWVTFLRQRAEAGSAAALSILQRQERSFECAVQACLSGSPDADLREQIIRELKPEPRADGQTVYRLRDGGRVVHGANGTSLEFISPFALTLFFRLRPSAGDGAAIRLNGSDEAIKLFILTAAAYAHPVTFAAPEHETERRRLIELVAGDTDGQAALQFAVTHQATRFGVSNSPPCLIWEADHVGEMTLERLVTLRNGARASLLRAGDTLLVKPCSDATNAEALIGQTVIVDKAGEIILPPKRFWRRSR